MSGESGVAGVPYYAVVVRTVLVALAGALEVFGKPR